jgi:hypothetical protein
MSKYERFRIALWALATQNGRVSGLDLAASANVIVADSVAQQ